MKCSVDGESLSLFFSHPSPLTSFSRARVFDSPGDNAGLLLPLLLDVTRLYCPGENYDAFTTVKPRL